MAAKRSTARKRATKRRQTMAPRRPVGRKPTRKGWRRKMAIKAAKWADRQASAHFDTRRAKRDAAIMRKTHEGCPTCHGNGQIYTQKKDGTLSGSKPCPAKPSKTTVSKWQIQKAARFGADQRSGLIGWKCPCGKREKPRYRDAKAATKALRTHERKKHGGISVGGAWYAQVPEGAPIPTVEAKPAKKKTTRKAPPTRTRVKTA
ncbi:hypothetical protein [Streptomyces asiaticus]|uniref:hypothetical protein n=1 Tax=Streptomyces asiaticus TaxID=114695 RepID=UPI001BA4F810|nr:hypothetical protein [Streptomyces asiaticus]